MEPAQHGVQDVLNISTEVHVFHRTRLDLDHARLEKDHARLDLDHEVSQNDRDFSLLARLPHTARTGDRTDGLIDPFDQFMHFDQPNLTKARILHLSEDIGHTWFSMVHDLDMVVHADSPHPSFSLPRFMLQDTTNLDRSRTVTLSSLISLFSY
ncbi:hypothetical protein F2Q69_00029958 [Brassica cretica]|uniref:Uncharacterized protein n=1 Tax=Brassica cretica TaxID=69181 RepID=A0A8S9S151_BRACR|nr:hypothetical protein F2Q69_00029958 [Brassica cretica]